MMLTRSKRSKIGYSAVPRVDLLPDAQRAERRLERLFPKLLIALVVSGVAAGLLFGVGFLFSTLAQNEYEAKLQENQQLVQQLAGLADVRTAMEGAQLLTDQRKQLTAEEVLFVDLRDRVVAELPAGSELTGVTAEITRTGAAAGSAAAETAAPLCAGTVADFSFTLLTPTLDAVSQFLASLTEVPGYRCALLANVEQSTAGGEDAVGMFKATVQVGFDQSIRADRFTDEGGAE